MAQAAADVREVYVDVDERTSIKGGLASMIVTGAWVQIIVCLPVDHSADTYSDPKKLPRQWVGSKLFTTFRDQRMK